MCYSRSATRRLTIPSTTTIGATLGHYRLIEQVGAGGVGVVYLARDERLERDVAIKVLSPRRELTKAARRSFRHEALALSRANHPNIATIHDFDSQDGLDYIVMEYIEGRPLSVDVLGGASRRRIRLPWVVSSLTGWPSRTRKASFTGT